MPAAEKSRINTDVKILGVVAGGGELPEKLVYACEQKGIIPFIIGFEGQTDPSIYEGHNHLITRLGAAGQIINTLKSHDIHDLVIIGSIRRPSLAELRPDWRTARFFAKIGAHVSGDDNLLSAIRKELEKEGFRIHGVQDFVQELLMKDGVLGSCKPGKADKGDIEQGIKLSQELGKMDIGQAIVMQEGIVLGVEAAEGTDELIHRCGRLKRKGRAPILVKTCKPQQDRNLDLPTIGPRTLQRCAEAGIHGIVAQAGQSLLIDPQKAVEIADQNKIFVIGVPVDND